MRLPRHLMSFQGLERQMWHLYANEMASGDSRGLLKSTCEKVTDVPGSSMLTLASKPRSDFCFHNLMFGNAFTLCFLFKPLMEFSVAE